MFTLFRFLPLIIGNFIPIMDDIWLFLLDYLYLSSFLMSPDFLEADYQVLGVLIRKFCLNNFFSAKKLKKRNYCLEQHLAAFREMYPAESIIFKQHKLIHFPRILKSSGPFLYQSVLKYERKHFFIKYIADNTNKF